MGVSYNNVNDKGKSRCKPSHNFFKRTDAYYPWLDILPLPTIVQLIDSLDSITYCVKKIDNIIFDVNVIFSVPLNHEALHKCYNDQDVPKGRNG